MKHRNKVALLLSGCLLFSGLFAVIGPSYARILTGSTWRGRIAASGEQEEHGPVGIGEIDLLTEDGQTILLGALDGGLCIDLALPEDGAVWVDVSDETWASARLEDGRLTILSNLKREILVEIEPEPSEDSGENADGEDPGNDGESGEEDTPAGGNSGSGDTSAGEETGPTGGSESTGDEDSSTGGNESSGEDGDRTGDNESAGEGDDASDGNESTGGGDSFTDGNDDSGGDTASADGGGSAGDDGSDVSDDDAGVEGGHTPAVDSGNAVDGSKLLSYDGEEGVASSPDTNSGNENTGGEPSGNEGGAGGEDTSTDGGGSTAEGTSPDEGNHPDGESDETGSGSADGDGSAGDEGDSTTGDGGEPGTPDGEENADTPSTDTPDAETPAPPEKQYRTIIEQRPDHVRVSVVWTCGQERRSAVFDLSAEKSGQERGEARLDEQLEYYHPDIPIVVQTQTACVLTLNEGGFPAGTRYTVGEEQYLLYDELPLYLPGGAVAAIDLSATGIEQEQIIIAGQTLVYYEVSPIEAGETPLVLENGELRLECFYAWGAVEPAVLMERMTLENGCVMWVEDPRIVCGDGGGFLCLTASNAPAGSYRGTMTWTDENGIELYTMEVSFYIFYDDVFLSPAR